MYLNNDKSSSFENYKLNFTSRGWKLSVLHPPPPNTQGAAMHVYIRLLIYNIIINRNLFASISFLGIAVDIGIL